MREGCDFRLSPCLGRDVSVLDLGGPLDNLLPLLSTIPVPRLERRRCCDKLAGLCLCSLGCGSLLTLISRRSLSGPSRSFSLSLFTLRRCLRWCLECDLWISCTDTTGPLTAALELLADRNVGRTSAILFGHAAVAARRKSYLSFYPTIRGVTLSAKDCMRSSAVVPLRCPARFLG